MKQSSDINDWQLPLWTALKDDLTDTEQHAFLKKQNAWTAMLRTENQSTGRQSAFSTERWWWWYKRKKRKEKARAKEREREGEREGERENGGTDDSTQLAHMSSLCSVLLNRQNHLRHQHSRVSQSAAHSLCEQDQLSQRNRALQRGISRKKAPSWTTVTLRYVTLYLKRFCVRNLASEGP